MIVSSDQQGDSAIHIHISILHQELPRWLSSKESACNAGDLGLFPGLGRSLEEGHGNPLPYSGLENPMVEEPVRLSSIGLHKVGYDLSVLAHMYICLIFLIIQWG